MAKVLVSIHDVHQANYLQIEQFLKGIENPELASRIALLVVPVYHSLTPLNKQTQFAEWLLEKHRQGHEIFAHGLHHCTSRVLARKGLKVDKIRKRSRWGRFVNKSLVRYEAEFCGWNEVDKEIVATQALEQFLSISVSVQGFVAPTWYGSLKPGTLQNLGCVCSESRFFVYNHQKGTQQWVFPLSFLDPQVAVGKWSVSFHPLLLFLMSTFFSTFRLCLHPENLLDRKLSPKIRKLLGSRTLIQYQDL